MRGKAVCGRTACTVRRGAAGNTTRASSDAEWCSAPAAYSTTALGEAIRACFRDCYALNNDLNTDQKMVHDGESPGWIVHLVDTGLHTQTGGRMRRLQPWVSETSMATYGDGVAGIARLLVFHRSHGRIATVTAVRPPSRFGGLSFNGNQVVQFREKPQTRSTWRRESSCEGPLEMRLRSSYGISQFVDAGVWSAPSLVK